MICYDMCKQRKHRVVLKCQSNIASRPATEMQGYTMTKNKYLTSLKASELRSLVYYGIYRTNLMLTGHALPQKLPNRTSRVVSAIRYIDVSQTEHSTNLQIKTTCHLRAVSIKLVLCHLSILSSEICVNIMVLLKCRIINNKF